MRTLTRVFATALTSVAATALVGCAVATTAAEPPASPTVSSPVPPPLPPQPTGSVGGIDAAIASQGPALLSPGGDPMAFSVTLTNSTSADIPDVRLVVSFGHCRCGYPGASIMPKGTMRMFDPATNAWVAAPYVVEGTGVDYIYQNLVPPFVLKQGQTRIYQLEARMDANPDVTAGSSLLTVTLTTPDAQGHAGSISVDVEP